MDRQYGAGEFGCYAHPSEIGVDPEDTEPGPVAGTHIRLMCDYGVTVPLWDEEGLLDEEPEYLQRELGISRALIADLEAWAADWDRSLPTPQQRQEWLARRPEHQEQGRRLLTRLEAEIKPRFTASLHL